MLTREERKLRRPLTGAEHEALGAELREMQRKLKGRKSQLAERYGRASRAARRCELVLRYLGQLLGELNLRCLDEGLADEHDHPSPYVPTSAERERAFQAHRLGLEEY